MKEYYLNQKEIKIIDAEKNNGIIELSIENKNKKVRCPKCNNLLRACIEKIKLI